MPHESTIFRWLAAHEEFQERYTCAKAVCAEYMGEELLDIADDCTNDWMKRNGQEDEEYWVANGEHIQRSKLRIHTRQWLMGKLKPKKYGDKQFKEVSGPDGGPVVYSDMTEEALDAAIKAKLADLEQYYCIKYAPDHGAKTP